ncbi:PD-(D/E)XK nuclease family protein [Halobacillus sp. HZG1]|uniref:PD-(D/E)XK nuclease family protein n=1 Tax=Halobacillus sp. HZG1 TaxID=3111769 RepID=UPI002DC04258|nr:PD-(D/E)XK nuclease family protein [Halobacillus sp. HZG1]MEC3885505.1 PD-(D/E)XK nuclease family protein [Halobacillus sp. HZG1]
MNQDEMFRFIEESFEENYELLRLEGGHSLSPHVKKLALEQVKNYWRKLNHLAENVADTEVRLTLPQQKSTRGRTYTIQGVVDVVREDEQTTLYDIKTHDAEYVRSNKHEFEGQLNIYSYIWQTIRGEKLDQTTLIATGETNELRKAKQRYNQTGDETYLLDALENWQPEIDIEVSPDKVQEHLHSFGEVVDLIEEHRYEPPSVDKIKTKLSDNKTFIDHVCSNCDIRFSCESYKEYAFSSSSRVKRDFLEFFKDFGTDNEKNEIIEANLEEEV